MTITRNSLMSRTGMLGLFLLLTGASWVCAADGVAIEELKGKVEVQRAGSGTWTPISAPTTLKDNDVIRTGSSSSAKLRWPNGLTSHLHQNTQLLVNLFENKHPSPSSRHATLFFGAAFFLLKATLPGLNAKDDTKVFTPTALVSIRGTSFSVEVAKGTGTTTVRVTNGTVLVRNILQSTSQFLRAGFQTEIGMNEQPKSPRLMNKEDIASLRGWVTSSVVDTELLDHLARGERARSAMVEQLKDKIFIVPLEDMSSYDGEWELGVGFGEFLAAQLKSAKNGFSVFVSEKSPVVPDETALQQGYRYMVTGRITDFELLRQAKVTTSADSYSEISEAVIGGSISLIDIATNRVVLTTPFSISKRAPVLTDIQLRKIASGAFGPANVPLTETVLGEAAEEAMQKAAQQILAYIHSQQTETAAPSR